MAANKQKEYVITVREVQDKWYSVQASTKARALEMIEEYEVDYNDTTWVKDHKPVVREVRVCVDCPNKGNGYTDVDPSVKVGTWDWHYNGTCSGTMVEGNEHGTCYECNTHMGPSNLHGPFRWLTDEEKHYLLDTYNTAGIEL